jgi:hypothetical protein
MSGLFKKPDTSGAERQLEETRKQTAMERQRAEEEKRDMMETEAARRRSRMRGGSRMLLSEARVAPETGIQTLGASSAERTA